MRRSLQLVVSVAIVTAIAFATITPVCGQLFACGCTFSEGNTFCNIRDAGSPDCPWCSYGLAGFYVPFAAIVAIGALATFDSCQRNNWRWWAGIAGGLIGYLGGALVVGLATALYRGYPLFLWWEL